MEIHLPLAELDQTLHDASIDLETVAVLAAVLTLAGTLERPVDDRRVSLLGRYRFDLTLADVSDLVVQDPHALQAISVRRVDLDEATGSIYIESGAVGSLPVTTTSRFCTIRIDDHPEAVKRLWRWRAVRNS